jgi:hypothetical protein
MKRIVPLVNHETQRRLVRSIFGAAAASVLAYIVNTESSKDTNHDYWMHLSDDVCSSGFSQLSRSWSVPKLSLEGSAFTLSQRTEPKRPADNASPSVTTIEYDFIVLGHGNAGKTAVETLKEQCPRASIALVDPLRSRTRGDARVVCYRQPALGFHPPTRTVELADSSIQLKYRHAILVATGSRGAPPPMDLFDKQVLNRVLELRSTEALGFGNRPILSPETIRHLALMAARQGAKVCVLGSGWEAIELASAVAKAGTEPPMLAFGSSGPLSHILPRYLSTAVTKKLRQQGIDIQERSLVRYVSHHVSPLNSTPRMEVHTAKAYDFIDTSRNQVDLMVVAPLVDGPRGTAVLPTLRVPEALQEHWIGRTWYQSWSQLTSPPTEPSTIVCFTDDGRVAVNAELNAASKVYAAGSVAKYPNSLTGHAHVAGVGSVDGALAGRLAAMHMARDYIDRTRSVPTSPHQQIIEPASFASSSFPIFRSDISPYSTAEGNRSSLEKVGITALVVGRCDSDTMSTHGFWWTNHSDKKTTSRKETTRSQKTRVSDSPVYGRGLVFYIDRAGHLCGIISWGLPFTDKDSTDLNPSLVNRMIEIISSDGGVIAGTSENVLLKTAHLAEESKRLVQMALEGKRSKGLHRRLTNKVEQMPNPLYRYTAAKPPSVTSVGLLKRKDQSVSSELLGENIYMKTDDIYNEVGSSIRPPTLLYIYPMHSPIWRGDDDTSKGYDPYLLSDEERVEQAWKDNEQRARPAKEEPLWLRRGDAHRGTSYSQIMKESFTSNMTNARFADGSVPLGRAVVPKVSSDMWHPWTGQTDDDQDDADDE